MRNLSLLLALVLLMVTSGTTRALSVGDSFTHELRMLMAFIWDHQEKEGRYPATWEELERTFPDLDASLPLLTPTRRMALLTPPLEITSGPHGGGKAVVMTRDPYRPVSWSRSRITHSLKGTLKEPVHGLLVCDNKGGITLLTMKPDGIPALFHSQGLELPAPSGLGAFPHEEKYETGGLFSWVVRTLGIASVALVVWLTWRSVRNQDHLERPHLPGS